MPASRTASPLMVMLVAACVAAAGCNGVAPTGPTPSATKKPGTPKDDGSPADAKPSSGLTNPAASYFGRVLGLDGKPAAGVEVRAFVIANHGGGLVTDNGAGLVTDNGAGVSGSNGGAVIANNGGNYALAQAGPSSVKTDEKGEFAIGLPPGQTANLEAVLSDTVKAIRGGVSAASRGVDLQLARTGAIRGKVSTPAERRITDYTGVDVFIPGTSYGAKADKDGNFAISNVPVGTYKLFATKTGVGQATSAAIKVASEAEAAAGEIVLALEPLAIKAVEPATAVEGQEVTITGERFGASTGATFQVLVGTSVVPTTAGDRRSDTEIKIKIPAGLTSGPVTVLVSGLPSDSKPLTIAQDFAISAPRAGYVLSAGPQALGASARDAAGAAVAPPPITWSVPAGGEFASVDATGKLTPLKAGTATVRAAAGALVADLKIKILTQAQPANGTLGGVASELLGSLGGLAFGPGGGLWLANYGNVLKYTAGAPAPTAFAGALDAKDGTFDQDPVDGSGADATFALIAGLTTGPDGRLWVCDDDAIRSISATGEVDTVASGALLTAPMHPVFVAGQLHFIDDVAIRKLDPASGELKTVVKDAGFGAMGLAAGPGDKLYVLVDGAIKVVSGDKLVTPPAAYRLAEAEEEDVDVDATAEAGEEQTDEEAVIIEVDESPSSLVLTADGSFYATAGAKIVKLVGADWTVIAGGADVPKDGAGTAAGFSPLIGGLVAGPDGALYVMDEGAVRKVDVAAAGVPVTTLIRSGSDLMTVRAKKPAQK